MKNDNKQNYWFKRRRYGYGWTPASWQGWVTIAVFLAIVLGGTVVLDGAPRNEFSGEVGTYLAIVALAIMGLLVISLKKGPTPKWRWGARSTDDPNKDV